MTIALSFFVIVVIKHCQLRQLKEKKMGHIHGNLKFKEETKELKLHYEKMNGCVTSVPLIIK